YLIKTLSLALFLAAGPTFSAQTSKNSFPSWDEGAAKKNIVEFVGKTKKERTPDYVAPAERIATFHPDGTLWVEHPMYTQVLYCFDRLGVLAKEKPELKEQEPFKTVLSGNREAIAKLSMEDLEKILGVTLSGMSVDEFRAEAKKWIA